MATLTVGKRITRQFGGDDPYFGPANLRKSKLFGERDCHTPRFSDLRGVFDGDRRGGKESYFHRVTVTVVPLPGADWISNSLTKRRLPLKPKPMPPPVE